MNKDKAVYKMCIR